MKYKKILHTLRTPFLTVTALSLMVGHAAAANLVAIEGQWTPSGGGVPITMWGFAPDTGQACNSLPAWTIGPKLSDTDLVALDPDAIVNDLEIHLRNCLSEPVSIIIPGQPATFNPQRVGGRVTAFVNEAPADNGVTTTAYTWKNVKDGTFLYQSGSHPALQGHMGLYGALVLGSYAGTSGDVSLLYSEIDPALHDPIPTAATPLNYHPRHFLVNGSDSLPNLTSVDGVGDDSQPTVLRLLNASLDYHVPALNGGHFDLVAEDGNPYPYPHKQYSVDLPAGKTIDALWMPAAGDHVIYDRRGNGMAASLTVGAGAALPGVMNDDYAVDEDDVLVAIAEDLTVPGVLDNDPGPGTLTAILVTPPVNGTLDPTLAIDGSFTYTPNPDFSGADLFTYKANDGALDSAIASVNIVVNPLNDTPVTVDDTYDVTEGTVLNIPAPGVLDNDSDADNEPFTAVLDTDATAGLLTLNADGSFNFDPLATVAGTIITFTYVADDGTVQSAPPATVTINVVAAVNNPPVAVEDVATVIRNSVNHFINLTDNDSDVDGNLKDGLGNVPAAQITITTGATTARGGTVTVVDNGVLYTPRRNFRGGSDGFSYIVTDLGGEPSNEVFVRINIVRP